MKKPLVSIIVPCYNQAEYLAEALDSVLAQTYSEWECIIVNDGSPDNTHEIAQQYCEIDNRFKYLYKENGGLSSARNAGIKISAGEFIQLLDSDDIIECDKINYQVNMFLEKPYIDIMVSGYRYFLNGTDILRIRGNNDFLPEVILLEDDDRDDVIRLFNFKNPFVISAPLYKSSIVVDLGGFDEELFALEDWELHFRVVLNRRIIHHIGYIPNTKTLIRLHENSMMRDTNRMTANYNIFRDKIEKLDLYIDFFGHKIISKIDDFPTKKPSFLRKFTYLVLPPIILKLYKRYRHS